MKKIIQNRDVFSNVFVRKLTYYELSDIEKTAKIDEKWIERAWEVIFSRDFPEVYENSIKDRKYVFAKLDSSSVNPGRKYYKRYYEYMKRLEPFIGSVMSMNLTFLSDFGKSSTVIGTKSTIDNLYKSDTCYYLTTLSNITYEIDFKNYPNCLKIVEKPEGKIFDFPAFIHSKDMFVIARVMTYNTVKFISFIDTTRVIDYDTDETAPLLVSSLNVF